MVTVEDVHNLIECAQGKIRSNPVVYAGCTHPAYALGVFQPGDKVTLDANEFLAPYRKDVLTRVIPKLEYLPLYKMSFEAKLRGEYATD